MGTFLQLWFAASMIIRTNSDVTSLFSNGSLWCSLLCSSPPPMSRSSWRPLTPPTNPLISKNDSFEEETFVGHLLLEPLLLSNPTLQAPINPFLSPWPPLLLGTCSPGISVLELFLDPPPLKAQLWCWFSPKWRAGGWRRRIWRNRKLFHHKLNVKLFALKLCPEYV